MHVPITECVAMYAIDSENVIFIIIAQWRLVLLWKCCWIYMKWWMNMITDLWAIKCANIQNSGSSNSSDQSPSLVLISRALWGPMRPCDKNITFQQLHWQVVINTLKCHSLYQMQIMNVPFIRLSCLPPGKAGEPDCLLDGRMILHFLKIQILPNDQNYC